MTAKKRPAAADSVAPVTAPAGSLDAAATRIAEVDASSVSKKPAARKSAKSAKSAPEILNGARVTPPKAAKASKRGATNGAASAESNGATKVATAVTTESATDRANVSIAPAASSVPARRAVTEEEVRQQAFYLSLRRTGPRDPMADWLEAERSLRGQSA
jgi:hypothetical protein